MKTSFIKNTVMRWSLAVACSGMLATAHSAVVTSAWYRGGEADSGVVIGSGPGTTLDAVQDSSLNNLDMTGGIGGPIWSTTTVPGSTVSYQLGSDRHAVRYTPVQTATTNWGMEAWFQASTFSDQDALFTIGTPATNGYGIYRFGSNISGFVHNNGIFGAHAITALNTWFYVALVNNGGNGTLYFGDGINPLVTVVSGTMTTPAAPASFTVLGSDTLGNFWNGSVDEARAFTFDAGQFSVSDLNYTAVPEPSTAALMALALAGTIIAHRRRRNARVA